eukprot:6191446-Pleurochrysis_carterae.AAC.1
MATMRGAARRTTARRTAARTPRSAELVYGLVRLTSHSYIYAIIEMKGGLQPAMQHEAIPIGNESCPSNCNGNDSGEHAPPKSPVFRDDRLDATTRDQGISRQSFGTLKEAQASDKQNLVPNSRSGSHERSSGRAGATIIYKIHTVGGWEQAQAWGLGRAYGVPRGGGSKGGGGHHERGFQELGERSASAPRVGTRCESNLGNRACECGSANERCARR